MYSCTLYNIHTPVEIFLEFHLTHFYLRTTLALFGLNKSKLIIVLIKVRFEKFEKKEIPKNVQKNVQDFIMKPFLFFKLQAISLQCY